MTSKRPVGVVEVYGVYAGAESNAHESEFFIRDKFWLGSSRRRVDHATLVTYFDESNERYTHVVLVEFDVKDRHTVNTELGGDNTFEPRKATFFYKDSELRKGELELRKDFESDSKAIVYTKFENLGQFSSRRVEFEVKAVVPERFRFSANWARSDGAKSEDAEK